MRLWKLAALTLLAAGCSGPVTPPTGPTPISPNPNTVPGPAPTPNNPPRILAVIVSTERAEVGDQVTVTANVSDDETPADSLKYEWTAPAGSFTGTGRVVTWKAPTGAGAVGSHKLTVAVVDQYGTPVQPAEHRVTAVSPAIRVEDSDASIRGLVLQFLDDFTHPEVSPQACVRNFSDSCRGKALELTDVTNNRLNFTILPSQSSYTISSVTINPARTLATTLARCKFTSIVKQAGPWGKPGDTTVATGNCRLTATYENQQWRLCESSLGATNTAGLHFIF